MFGFYVCLSTFYRLIGCDSKPAGFCKLANRIYFQHDSRFYGYRLDVTITESVPRITGRSLPGLSTLAGPQWDHIGVKMILLYLDPGSGSFLIQLLIAALAGAGLAIAISWGRIKRFFSKNKHVDVDKDVDEDEDDDQPGV
jgi:hypothetical protein